MISVFICLAQVSATFTIQTATLCWLQLNKTNLDSQMFDDV